MSSSVSSLSDSTSSNLDTLVQQYTQSISEPVYQMQAEQTTVNTTITYYQDLKTKLSNFQSQLNNFTMAGSLSPLAAKTGTSSNTSVVTATAQSTAVPGNHTILVTQLAKNDTLVSSELNQSGTDISTATGAGTFKISIGAGSSPTSVSVNVSAGDTNSTVLSNIASAVNAANVGVTASVINDTSSTARLVFTSNQSGSASAITVSDSTGNLAAAAGWTGSVISGRTTSTSTQAGYVTGSSSSLDANFTLDGIPIVRGSNSVSDVLAGVTLSLTGIQQSTDNPVNLSVGSDTSSVQTSIQNLINSYNTVITTLNQDITTNATTQVRGPLAGDVSFMNLQNSLQSMIMGQVSSTKSGNPNMLSEIGITLNSDGTLSISDQAELTDALTTNPNAVTDLFNSSNGVAVQLNTLVSSFSNAGGIMDQKISGAQDQVNAMNDQINSMQASINIQADAMRAQFTSYLNLLAQLTQTQNTMNSIWTQMYSSSSSG